MLVSHVCLLCGQCAVVGDDCHGNASNQSHGAFYNVSLGMAYLKIYTLTFAWTSFDTYCFVNNNNFYISLLAMHTHCIAFHHTLY